MKKLLLAAYIFFCTGGTYAQDRKDTVVGELDFNKPVDLSRYLTTTIGKVVNPDTLFTIIYDTVQVSLLVTKGPMTMAHHIPGFVVLHWSNVIKYLDDRRRPLKAPITVWSMKRKENHP